MAANVTTRLRCTFLQINMFRPYNFGPWPQWIVTFISVCLGEELAPFSPKSENSHSQRSFQSVNKIPISQSDSYQSIRFLSVNQIPISQSDSYQIPISQSDSYQSIRFLSVNQIFISQSDSYQSIKFLYMQVNQIFF